MSKAQSLVSRFFGIVATIVVFGGSSLVILYCFHQIWLKYQSGNWPYVTGTITASKMDCYESKGTHCSAHIRYRYKVNGNSYENSRITFGQNSPGRVYEVEEKVAYYAVGKRVPVFYKPNSPGTSCLESGLSLKMP